jgi:serine-type D-Ala-D-Ala carboxypeptidase/endopeptidase
MRFRYVRSMILCLLALIAGAGSSLYGQELKAKVDALVQPLIDGHEMVGCVVGVFKDGKPMFAGYGETTKGSGKKPTVTTIYEIGSVGKVFTGVLLADMVNAGQVKLDDPLQKYVPKSVKVPVNAQPITLEHLVTHTSGLTSVPDNLQPKDALNPWAGYTVKQMYEFLMRHELRRAPGEYEYSNYGMGLLGYVLGDSQRSSYEQLVIDRIAKPLGMRDTRVTLNAEQMKRMATPYDEALTPTKNWDDKVLAGAGSHRSTGRDMMVFLRACLADNAKPVTHAIRSSQKKLHTMGDGQSMGLGWHLHPDGATWWHNGGTGGYSSWLSVVPSRKAAVVVLANTATPKTDELGLMLTALACGIDVPAQAIAARGERKEVEVDPKVLETYTGYFEIMPDFGLTVTLEGGKLMVQGTGQEKIPVVAEGKAKFYSKAVDAHIFFVPNDAGGVNHLVLHQGGANLTGTRKKQGAAEEKDVPQKEVELAACTGVFRITPNFAITVTHENDKLVVQATNQGKFQLQREAGNKFTCIGVDAKISFVHDAEGKVTHLILHQNGDKKAKREEQKDEEKQQPQKEVALEDCTGVFAINPNFAMTVTLENGSLVVQATNQGKIQLKREPGNKFSCIGVDAKISFVPDAAGKVSHLILHQNGDQKATRKE